VSRLSTSFILGYHGCDRSVGERVLSGDLDLIQSDKEYDWLGPGVYFWENDPVRAREWADSKVRRGDYAETFVIGAVIDLGNCLDLLVRENLELLRWAYEDFVARRDRAGLAMPENEDARTGRPGDKLLRFLDCAVIRNLHSIIDDQPSGGHPEIGEYIEPFDTVRGMFTEGEHVYPGSGFYALTHTQVAVRTDRCIKGVFLPR
jgi:hypothetical protein